jgi:hypothetical protein
MAPVGRSESATAELAVLLDQTTAVNQGVAPESSDVYRLHHFDLGARLQQAAVQLCASNNDGRTARNG